MAKYQGHKNWNHWNVSLWINNDEGLYMLALNLVGCYSRKDAAIQMRDRLCDEQDSDRPITPDGAPYSVTTIRAAMVGM